MELSKISNYYDFIIIILCRVTQISDAGNSSKPRHKLRQLKNKEGIFIYHLE